MYKIYFLSHERYKYHQIISNLLFIKDKKYHTLRPRFFLKGFIRNNMACFAKDVVSLLAKFSNFVASDRVDLIDSSTVS